MIRPYLRDLINEQVPTMELNNNNNNNNNSKNSNNNSDSDCAEWKIQLTMQNTCISTRSLEETHTIYTKSEPVEIFMGSNTEDVIDRLFNTLLQRFQRAQETSNDRGSEFIPDSVELLYYHFQRTDIRRAESYIMSPDWIASKKATINPKNEKDNKCFQWSIIAGLNYNKIKEKELKKIEKFKRVDTDFSSYQREWEEFEQNNTSVALNILFAPHNSEEIKLAYKSNYNKRKNQIILLMINVESYRCYYFAVKNLSELNSLGWLRGKKETMISGDTDFEDALDDALNYQTIKTNPERISKLKPYINKYNWEGINFPAGSKEWQKFERNNDTIALNVLYVEQNTKKISVAYKSKYNNKRKKQVILLMIGDGEKYHYLAVTNLSALFQGNSSNHEGDFYCLNCFSSYTAKNKLKEHEEICNNRDSCHI